MQHLDRITWSLAASVAVSLVALSARLVVWLPPARLRAWLPWMQASAAGLLLGDALLHMLPEAMDRGLSANRIGEALALGVLALVCIETLVRSFRAPTATATFARMDIVGDFLHHLADGVVIGASFAIDATLGLVVALAIAGHALPREVGNAGVLVAGGFAPRRAFSLSVLTTAAVPLGAMGILVLGHSEAFLGSSLALAAGTTIYLACGDILPALWQSTEGRQRFIPALGVAGGIAFMWLAAALRHGF